MKEPTVRQVSSAIMRMPGPVREFSTLEDFDGESIFESEFPEPLWIIRDLLPVGLTILPGRPKVGKSWLALQLALAVATGTLFCGRLVIEECAKVVYLGLEEPKRRTSSRMKRLYGGASNMLQNIRFIYKILPLLGGGAEELDEYLRLNPARLVVIDTFLSLVGSGGNRGDLMRSDYDEVNRLRQIADQHKVAMVVVHHTRKMGGDAIDTVAGTTGITAGCDAIWSLRKLPDGTAVLEMTGREIEERTFGLRLQTGAEFGWRITGEGAEVGMSEERQDILTLLQQEGALKPARIALLLKKNANTIRRLLQGLSYEDLVRKNANGCYFSNQPPENGEQNV